MMKKSKIEKLLPGLMPGNELKADGLPSSPAIAKPHVGGRCGQIRKTSKRFDLEKKMWRESYILFNFLELIVYKVMKGYPCKTYKIITKYKLKFYDRK